VARSGRPGAGDGHGHAAAVAVDHGAPAPSADDVGRLTAALDQVAETVRDGARPSARADLPDQAGGAQDETLAPVADAVRGVQAVVV
jgi:hypothetical protein